MTLIRPTRREFIAGASFAGASAFAHPALSQTNEPSANFLVVGDWGRKGRDFQRHVADRMGEKAVLRRSNFIASTADNFYTFGVSSVRDRQWRTSFEDIYTHDGLQSPPWYPVLGNHDYGGNVDAQVRYGGPSSRWQMHDRYYKESISGRGGASADLFFIDTVAWIGREALPFYFLGTDIEEGNQRDQTAWLVRELERSTARFKFVFGHHGIHSIGPHGGEMQMAQLDNVLRRFGVTAYIHGHDHCLFHISHRGMDYICSGGGSAILATYTGGPQRHCVYTGFCNQTEEGNDLFPRWHAFIRDAGFASFDIHPDQVEFELLGLHGGRDGYHRATLYPRRAGLEPA